MLERRKIGKAVLPARMHQPRKKIIGYAVWKGIILWSTREVPVFVKAETT